MAEELRPEFRKGFLDELLAVEQYVGRQQAQRGRAFTQAVFDFAYSIVATVPLGFPAYTHPLTPEMSLRRAVFRREYALLYYVTPIAVVFVYFCHTRRDISQQPISL